MLSEAAQKLLRENLAEINEIVSSFKVVEGHPYLPGVAIITPDNWTEFVQKNSNEKDWEILSYYYFIGGKYEQVDANVSHGLIGLKILSVKRLSDNAVFQVGDETQAGKIIEFEEWREYPGDLMAKFNGLVDNITAMNITKLKHKRTPLFKTEDGVDVFDGDKCWLVDEKYWSTSLSDPINKIDYDTYSYKYFSTEEAAREYVKFKKPLFSLDEIATNYKGNFAHENFSWFTNLAEQKLNP